MKFSSNSWRFAFIGFGLLMLSAIMRLLNLSHGAAFHPDERHIVMTVGSLTWSKLNPHTFAYGSLPFYLIFFLGKLLGNWWPELDAYDGLFLVGRSVSVAFGVLGILLTFVLGKKLTGSVRIAFLAAFLLATNPFHIQLSRFATVDCMLTTLNLAVLVSCLWVVERKSLFSTLVCGVLIGLSIATKISSLSLFLPAALAVCAAFGGAGWYKHWRFWTGGVLVLVASAVVGIAAQPYAYLDYQTFLSHTTEQVNMVRGLWRPPYTIQYANTTPYLYHLGQMAWYNMGLPIFTAAVIGCLITARALLRRLDWSNLIVGAWAVAVFLIVARYQVKFPRYLLPLYPFLMVMAGLALEKARCWIAERWDSTWALLPGAAASAFSLFSALAFIQIYTEEHGYVQASRWIYEHVPKGSALVGVHWDDKLPLSLPGVNPFDYRFRYEGDTQELPVYEPESPHKLNLITERLAQADYLIFPTARTYASIMRLPDEFETTCRFFQLLFAGKLGFELDASVKVRPNLLGRTIDDDLADESFSVYDHPKSLIFRNTLHLSPAELISRVEDRSPSNEELPSRADMLRASATAPISAENLGPVAILGQLVSVLGWYAIVQLLAFLVLPVLVAIFSAAPDHGYAFSKALGVVLFAASAWFLGSFAALPVSPACLWLLLVGLAVGALHAVRSKRDVLAHLFGTGFRTVITTEVLFALSFLSFLVIRALNPEIFWGEKPMDFSFLNYFTRLGELPPDDPWFYRPGPQSGMNYYYLGFFAYGLLLKLTGISPGVGYNLALASVAASVVTSAYGVLLWFSLRPRLAVFGALLLVCGSNIEVLYLLLVKGRELNFDLFWASSRGFTSPSITEYPWWSFLFADLHPHVMAMPLTVALLGIGAAPALGFVPRRAEPLAALLAGLLVGILAGLNSWDVIILGSVVAALAFLWLISSLLSVAAEERAACVERWVFSGAIFAVAAGLVVGALSSSAHSEVQVGYGYVTRDEFDTFGQVFRHLGVWLTPSLLGVFLLSAPHLRHRKRDFLFASIAALALVLAPALLSFLAGIRGQPWGVVGLAFLTTLAGTWFVALARRPAERVAGVFLCAAGLILVGAELFFLMDRMNTIFKFYLPLWFVLGSAALIVTEATYRRLELRLPRLLFVAATVSVCTMSVLGSLMNLGVMTTFRRIDGPRPTLDGSAYLEQLDGDEAKLSRWLNKNIRGIVPIVEAWGPSYAEFTRVTMRTGLPVVLGWEYHVLQRGAPRSEIEQRKRDVREIYTTQSVDRLRALLRKYEIKLIVAGNIERRAYPSASLVLPPEGGKLPEFLSTLAQFGPVSVLQVKGD